LSHPSSLPAALPIPAVPSAVNVTGLPASPLEVAVSVFVPAVVLRVQPPTVAIPLPFVVWVPPVTLPLPAAAAKVTVTPCTGLPLPSCTITDGGEPTALPPSPSPPPCRRPYTSRGSRRARSMWR